MFGKYFGKAEAEQMHGMGGRGRMICKEAFLDRDIISERRMRYYPVDPLLRFRDDRHFFPLFGSSPRHSIERGVSPGEFFIGFAAIDDQSSSIDLAHRSFSFYLCFHKGELRASQLADLFCFKS